MKKSIQVYIQATLWMAYAVLLTLIINKTFSFSDSIIKASTLILIQMALFYYNSQKLFPNLIADKKTWSYLLKLILILLLLLLFFIWFERQFFPDSIPEIGQNRWNRMMERSPRGRPPRHQLINLLIVLDFLSLLIILILSSAYAATHISRKKEKLDAEKSLQNLSSEMNFLKSQINPHFLFNALNNIYSLTLTGSERSSEMILKLSEMLRYILYECSDAYVKIEKEWDYILNYIDFMQLKSKEKLNINLSFKNDHASSLITPMIFVPFIENAFKHSNVENSEVGYIHISLNNKEDEIVFQVDNSLSTEKQSRDEMGGIGLDNVKRRLELVYGTDFDLIINDTEQRYSVILRIQKSSPKNEKK